MISSPLDPSRHPEIEHRRAEVLGRLDGRLPIRPKPLHHEKPESYLARALSRNFLSPNLSEYLFRKYREVYPEPADENLMAMIAERKGGLDPGFFQRVRPTPRPHPDGSTCNRCGHNFGEQYACRLCSAGEIVKIYPTIERNVCLRHQLWIAPGVHTALQPAVDPVAIGIERKFRKLVRTSRVDAPMLSALVDAYRRVRLVRNCTADQGFIMAGASYGSMVNLAQALTQSRFVAAFFDPRMTFYQSHSLLSSVVAMTTSNHAPGITQALWEQYRPVFLRVREWSAPGRRPMRWTGHDFGLNEQVLASWQPLPKSFEPFRRFMDVAQHEGIPGTQAKAVPVVTRQANATHARKPRGDAS